MTLHDCVLHTAPGSKESRCQDTTSSRVLRDNTDSAAASPVGGPSAGSIAGAHGMSAAAIGALAGSWALLFLVVGLMLGCKAWRHRQAVKAVPVDDRGQPVQQQGKRPAEKDPESQLMVTGATSPAARTGPKRPKRPQPVVPARATHALADSQHASSPPRTPLRGLGPLPPVGRKVPSFLLPKSQLHVDLDSPRPQAGSSRKSDNAASSQQVKGSGQKDQCDTEINLDAVSDGASTSKGPRDPLGPAPTGRKRSSLVARITGSIFGGLKAAFTAKPDASAKQGDAEQAGSANHDWLNPAGGSSGTSGGLVELPAAQKDSQAKRLGAVDSKFVVGKGNSQVEKDPGKSSSTAAHVGRGSVDRSGGIGTAGQDSLPALTAPADAYGPQTACTSPVDRGGTSALAAPVDGVNENVHGTDDGPLTVEQRQGFVESRVEPNTLPITIIQAQGSLASVTAAAAADDDDEQMLSQPLTQHSAAPGDGATLVIAVAAAEAIPPAHAARQPHERLQQHKSSVGSNPEALSALTPSPKVLSSAVAVPPATAMPSLPAASDAAGRSIPAGGGVVSLLSGLFRGSKRRSHSGSQTSRHSREATRNGSGATAVEVPAELLGLSQSSEQPPCEVPLGERGSVQGRAPIDSAAGAVSPASASPDMSVHGQADAHVAGRMDMQVPGGTESQMAALVDVHVAGEDSVVANQWLGESESTPAEQVELPVSIEVQPGRVRDHDNSEAAFAAQQPAPAPGPGGADATAQFRKSSLQQQGARDSSAARRMSQVMLRSSLTSSGGLLSSGASAGPSGAPGAHRGSRSSLVRASGSDVGAHPAALGPVLHRGSIGGQHVPPGPISQRGSVLHQQRRSSLSAIGGAVRVPAAGSLGPLDQPEVPGSVGDEIQQGGGLKGLPWARAGTTLGALAGDLGPPDEDRQEDGLKGFLMVADGQTENAAGGQTDKRRWGRALRRRSRSRTNSDSGGG